MLASLGCGNPTAVADLHEGERVLDLGSGGGIDVLLSAKRVGPSGRVFGLDMTDEMLDLARRNADEAGATNVEFLKGQIEAIPLPAGSIDVVISNCVVNLAADKPAVFREIARVLRPGGRIGITDIVAEDALTPTQRAERGSYVGCIAGALSFTEFESGLRDAGLTDVSLTPTHLVTDGMHSVIAQADQTGIGSRGKPNRRAPAGDGRLRLRLRRLLLGNPDQSRDGGRRRCGDDDHQDRSAQREGNGGDGHADESRVQHERLTRAERVGGDQRSEQRRCQERDHSLDAPRQRTAAEQHRTRCLDRHGAEANRHDHEPGVAHLRTRPINAAPAAAMIGTPGGAMGTRASAMPAPSSAATTARRLVS